MGFQDEKTSPETTFVLQDGNDLDVTFDFVIWRTRVSENLTELENRIAALEHRKSNFFRDSVKQLRGKLSSYAISGNYGLEGIPTCIHLIMTKRVALLQCIWLFLCVFVFSFVGIQQFIRAKANEESEWKPETIGYITDYGRGDVKLQYEMPNLYLFLKVSLPNGSAPLAEEDISTILENMLVSQNYFNNSVGITYLTPDFQVHEASASCKEVNFFFLNSINNDSFSAYLKIRLSNPDPKMGSFWFWLLMNTEDLVLDKTLEIIGFWVYVGRDLSKLSLTNLAYVNADESFKNNVTMSYTVDYTESIHIGWKTPIPTHRFVTETAWGMDRPEWWTNYSSGTYITFRGNERIETWEEYVDFSYYDWVFAMGGLINLVTIVYFFVSYHIATKLGDTGTLGILPGLSKTFRNLEMLSLIKTRLELKKILVFEEEYEEDPNLRSLPSRITDFGRAADGIKTPGIRVG